jgi:transcriptional regulator with XRE-family HTH domain
VVAYVRLVNATALLEAIAAHGTGTQTEVAASAGISLQRLNQIVREVAPVVPVATAAALERALGVPVGALFAPDDAELLRRYIANASSPSTPDSPEPASPPAPPSGARQARP